MDTNKAITFIGFSVRARKCKIGVNAVATLKRAEVVIVCKSASLNTVADAKKLAKRFHCPVYQSVNTPLEQMVHKDNAKVMAITDKALATAFKQYSEKEFTEIFQENING